MNTSLSRDERKAVRCIRAAAAVLFAAATAYAALSFALPALPMPRMEYGITRTGILLNAVLGLPLLYLAPLIERLLRHRLPAYLHIGFTLFLLGAMLLGNVLGFFRTVPHWDDLLHAGSSLLSGLFGVELLRCGTSVPSSRAGKLTCALFAFCFAMAIGGVWEIAEYAGDSLFGMNAQRALSIADGTPLAGHAALYDTMKDLIVDCVGASCAALISGCARRNA
ncbi:MAG: hypothetical protein ACI3XP_05795 [Eubacteriales bacterium]